MGPPNVTWRDITVQAAQMPDILKDAEVIKNVQNILQTNVSVCSSLGHPFLSQMSRIYTDMLNFYRCAALPCGSCSGSPAAIRESNLLDPTSSVRTNAITHSADNAQTAWPSEWHMRKRNGQCSGLLCHSWWWWILF